jgi:spore coat protein U domain-containing protein, fimbrial subunit CupE1/2/3/6
MSQQLKLLAFSVLALVLLASTAEGAANCSISTVGVAFGSYDVFGATLLTSTGSVTINCVGIGSGTSLVSVRLSTGNGASFQPRQMFRGTESLNYNLYLNAAGTQIWGDGTGGSILFSTSVSNNQTVNTTIFGQIPAGQDVSVGSYLDTIVATINF